MRSPGTIPLRHFYRLCSWLLVGNVETRMGIGADEAQERPAGLVTILAGKPVHTSNGQRGDDRVCSRRSLIMQS